MIGSWFTKLRIKALESCRSTPLSFGCGPRGVREGTSALPTHLNFVIFIHSQSSGRANPPLQVDTIPGEPRDRPCLGGSFEVKGLKGVFGKDGSGTQ